MEIYIVIFIAAVAIFVMTKALSSIWGGRKKFFKAKSKMPSQGYKLFYSDQKGERKEGVIYSKLLKSQEYDITGKPDYIYKSKGTLLPIELKSGEIGEKDDPHPGDLMQLAAYFVLIEEHYEATPIEGRIIYKDFMFTVKNTKKIRRELKSTLADMRAMLKHGEGEPAANFVTCKHCICKATVCEYCDI